MIQTEVFCTLRFTALHRWKEPILGKEYLKDFHRHEFHVKAWKTVSHFDRDIEFIKLKEDITQFVREAYENKETEESCESIANVLLLAFGLSRCEVSEDGENGALVTIVP